jgi:chlorobactene glucosyltransferase
LRRLTPLWMDGVAALAACLFAGRTIHMVLHSAPDIEIVEPSDTLPFLSIIVPARNEERQIAQCVRSLLQQRYPRFELIVVDDGSTDRTRSILRQMQAYNPQLRVIDGATLPPGWIGKPWALAQGAREARGQWLLFTDADTMHEPLASCSAVSYARSNGLGVLSLLPRQRFESIAERVMLPTILSMIAFAVGSLNAINDPRRPEAAIFNGQYVLFDRHAYEKLGGYDAVRNRIAEDYELARLVKRDGRFRSRLAGATELVSTRMYRSFGEIWSGFTKNLYAGAREAPAHGVAGALFLMALSPLPEVLLVTAVRKRSCTRVFSLIATMLLSMAAAEIGMRRWRFPRGSGLYFPIGACAMTAIFLNSAIAHGSGHVTWRGRAYSRRTSLPPSQT